MLLRVLHIDTGRSWRGGQKQLQTLLGQLPAYQVESHLVIPRGVVHARRLHHGGPLVEKALGPLSQIKTLFELARYCSSHHIELLHAHTAKAHTLAVALNLVLPTKLPLIVHRHVVFQPSSGFFHRFKYGPRAVSHYIAISQAVKKALQSYGIPPQAITVIKTSYEGPIREPEDKRHAKEALSKRLPFYPQKLVMGFCGALTPEKGCFDLIKAIALLRKSTGEAPQLLIAGEGPLRESLQREIDRLKLHESVKLVGFVEAVDDFFAALDILVFPSLSEGLGLTLLEAAFGLCAVVATRVGGVGEVIVHQKTGISVGPNSPREIVRGLEQLLANPLLRLKYALNLRAHVRKNFSPQTMGKSCAALYRRICLEKA